MATSTETSDLVSKSCKPRHITVGEEILLSMHGLDNMQLPVVCDVCLEEFDDLNMFDTHMATHQECQYFSCQLCNNTYQSWGNLVAHRKACHQGKVLNCEDCGKRKFHPNLGVVNFPVGNLAHGCEECFKGFSSMPDLMRHYSKKHTLSTTSPSADKSDAVTNGHKSVLMNLACPLCKKTFTRLKPFLFHIRMLDLAPNQIGCSCDICQTNLCNEQLLAEHMNVHANLLPQCLETNTMTSVLNLHSTCSDNKQPLEFADKNDSLGQKVCYSCLVCKQTFTVQAALKGHMKLHNPIKDKTSYKTSKTVTSSQESCVDHLQAGYVDNMTSECENVVHTAQSQPEVQRKAKFICEYCGREFKKKENLMLHVRRHLGERPYSCQHCSKSLFTNQQLSIHSYRHSGERPYICEIQACKKTFTSPTALYMHRKLHNNSTAYKCPHCKRQFLYQSSYIGHIRLHTGHRPFPCPVCDKTFTLKGKLNLHLKKHTHESLIQNRCSDCGSYFATEDELSSHCNDKCCVTLVTVSKESDNEVSGATNQDNKQYIIIY